MWVISNITNGISLCNYFLVPLYMFLRYFMRQIVLSFLCSTRMAYNVILLLKLYNIWKMLLLFRSNLGMKLTTLIMVPKALSPHILLYAHHYKGVELPNIEYNGVFICLCLFISHMYRCFLCMNVYVLYTCLVLTGARKGSKTLTPGTEVTESCDLPCRY